MSESTDRHTDGLFAVSRAMAAEAAARKPVWRHRWMILSLGLAISLVLGGAIAMAMWHNSRRVDYYFVISTYGEPLAEETMDAHYEDDSVLNVGLSPGKGKVTVWVNGSPAVLTTGGMHIYRITHRLSRGKNTVELRGDHDNPMFIKIFTSVDEEYTTLGRFRQIIAKAKFPPGAEAAKLQFDVQEDLSCPFERLPQDAQGKAQCIQQVLAIQAKAFEYIENGDGQSTVDLLFPRSVIQELKDRRLKAELTSNREQMKRGIEDAVAPTVLTEVSHLKVVYGANGVLVHEEGEPTEKIPSGYFSFRFKDSVSSESDVQYAPPISFARISGRWTRM